MADLPEWAELRSEDPIPTVDVDADAMYEALLSEYADHYADGVPEEFGDAGQGLDPESPTQYWLEVCYQSMKLDLWVALGTMQLEIRVHDREKTWRQDDYPEGRGIEKASGGLTGPREGVEHYRNLRRVLPAGVRT